MSLSFPRLRCAVYRLFFLRIYDSCAVRFQDVYILASRAPNAEFNAEAEAARLAAEKLIRLEALEAALTQVNEGHL